MANQLFADLVAEYRKPEMGVAILALFHFYEDCLNKKANINSEYQKLYNEQIKKPLEGGEEVDEKVDKKLDFANTLHFQRRLVAQFYADMADLYSEYPRYRSLIKKINNWFTFNELNLLKIILLLAKPASNVFIQVGNVPKPPTIDIQMYKSIRSLYKKVSKHIA